MSSTKILHVINKYTKPYMALEVIPQADLAWGDLTLNVLPDEFGKMPYIPAASKLGGMPYIPNGMEYPKNEVGEPLYLLAQINLVDAPALDPFPRDGILQFYIDNIYQDNFAELGRVGYKVIYIPHPDNYANCLDIREINFREPTYFPILSCQELRFSLASEVMPTYYPHFEKSFETYIENDPDFFSLYDQLFFQGRTKLGGYTHTSSLEEYGVNVDEYEVLLQLYASETGVVLFHDPGHWAFHNDFWVFLIKREALKRLDFSEVLLYFSSQP